MRVSRWILGLSAVAAVAAGAFAGGCSSSSPAPARVEAAPDAEAAEASCSVDADLTMFAMSDASAAGCAACIKNMCGMEIGSCASDCTCISLFTCLADAGVGATGVGVSDVALLGQCVPGGFAHLTALESNAAVKGIFNCFGVTCSDECTPAGPPEGDAGEAGTSPEAGSTDAGDAGTPADGGTKPDGGDAGPPG